MQLGVVGGSTRSGLSAKGRHCHRPINIVLLGCHVRHFQKLQWSSVRVMLMNLPKVCEQANAAGREDPQILQIATKTTRRTGYARRLSDDPMFVVVLSEDTSIVLPMTDREVSRNCGG